MPVVAAMGLVFGRDTLMYWLEWTVVLHVAMAGIFGFSAVARAGSEKDIRLLWRHTFQLCGSSRRMPSTWHHHRRRMAAICAARRLPLAQGAKLARGITTDGSPSH